MATVISSKVQKPTIVANKTETEAAPKTVVVDPTRRLQNPLADIVFLYESAKDMIAQIKESIKVAALNAHAKFIDGEEFAVGQIKKGAEPTEIDSAKFVRAAKKAGVKEADMYSCLKVTKAAAEKFLPGNVLDEISSKLPARSPSMEIDAAKGAHIPAVDDALFRVAEYFREVMEANEANLAASTTPSVGSPPDGNN